MKEEYFSNGPVIVPAHVTIEIEQLSWDEFLKRAAIIAIGKKISLERMLHAIDRALALIQRGAERTTQNWRWSRLEAMEKDMFDWISGVSQVTTSVTLQEAYERGASDV